jgi:protocatechuate 3,4-dioxygenase beta subunit
VCFFKGRFEYQTVIPPPYLDNEDNTWRCPHIHHFIQASEHMSCVTQIMFPDMPRNDTDNHIRKELVVPLERKPLYWLATPVFVLKKEGSK